MEYELKHGNIITRFQVGPSDDGEFMGIEFWRDDGTSFVVALPLNFLHKFREQVDWGFEHCAQRAALAKDEQPTKTLQ